MSTVFNEPNVWRECNQWRSVFATPSDGTGQLFANFGSIDEDTTTVQDVETMIQVIANQFAMDVYNELKNDVTTEQLRAVKTSQAETRRTTFRPMGPHKTPTVTPINSRRGQRTHTGANGRASIKYV
ncbi:hypothetical protein TVAG_470140 [Trichomonas vaginalis G3]|uniref:Uncharacterized protein n=1 Tax=Trichomonas vaginalis (strain ATCC PRA-98 / G3) TaxID=412133 RepID=A2FE21_TRIV3|nr:hypothetical protein TVAGG3_0553480 [Trichomonas vaginalis G3]EAX96849.1 hypothetical protein TVAG_470140 [Trichomonas vaginalis G3]KAI5520686.1 hypothetical protein TVAGG3_0553480 [Trichomonas vaginalis G3]|eukprot:XP_001309779.1 hypothetical protein [Trichomonas vaginalis G3]